MKTHEAKKHPNEVALERIEEKTRTTKWRRWEERVDGKEFTVVAHSAGYFDYFVDGSKCSRRYICDTLPLGAHAKAKARTVKNLAAQIAALNATKRGKK